MNAIEIAKLIDHTLLKPDATREDVYRLCYEAVEHGFFAVCVNSSMAGVAAKALEGTGIITCSVAGFPFGAQPAKAKAYEAARALEMGAGEIDMVMNIGAAKEGDWDLVREDIAAVVGAVKGAGVKVILENCLLTDMEKVKACIEAMHAGACFVKTSTGFSKGGATLEDVKLMRKTVGENMGVKAAGGIRDYVTAIAMIKAGADRLGTSAGVAIIRGALEKQS